ncbi:MAG: hypothetical protein E1N59_388 [Puniceicoccaceae bacterium 5H]|nr:MAG: hypothetical protein E1N59_388 [Puniceicoccaceae bacterium 5H]
MALISRQWKLLFIMPGGTGCSSIGRVMERELGAVYLPAKNLYRHGRMVFSRKHNSVEQLLARGFLMSDELEKLTVFATVRNAFDLVASNYAREASGWLGGFPRDADGNLLPIPDDVMAQHQRRAQEIADAGFERWVQARYGRLARCRHQLKLRLKGQRETHYYRHVDQLVRFEHLERDFNAVLRSVGFPRPLVVPNVNPTLGRKPYRQYYTERARCIVDRAFRDQLERFGYAF